MIVKFCGSKSHQFLHQYILIIKKLQMKSQAGVLLDSLSQFKASNKMAYNQLSGFQRSLVWYWIKDLISIFTLSKSWLWFKAFFKVSWYYKIPLTFKSLNFTAPVSWNSQHAVSNLVSNILNILCEVYHSIQVILFFQIIWYSRITDPDVRVWKLWQKMWWTSLCHILKSDEFWVVGNPFWCKKLEICHVKYHL